MKKFIYGILWSFLVILFTLYTSYANAATNARLHAFTLGKTAENFNSQKDVTNNKTAWIYWEHSLLDLIQLINNYLRFGIWFVCFLFMVVNGYKLITAHWDSKKTEAATSGLMKSIIWIGVCLLAYIIVNVTVKLFM